MLLRRFSLFPSCKEGIKAGDMTFGELTNYMARHVYLEEMTQKGGKMNTEYKGSIPDLIRKVLERI